MLKKWIIGLATALTMTGSAWAELKLADLERFAKREGIDIIDKPSVVRDNDTLVVRTAEGTLIIMGLVDQFEDGRSTLLVNLAIYKDAGYIAPEYFNLWNQNTVFKAFGKDGDGTLMQSTAMVGNVDQETIAGAFRMFTDELERFEEFLYTATESNTQRAIQSVSLSDERSAREVHDSHLTLGEIKARDADLALQLNASMAPNEVVSLGVQPSLKLTKIQRRALLGVLPSFTNELE